MSSNSVNRNIIALLKWRKVSITNENIQKLKNCEYSCMYNPFVELSILKKNIDLNKYRQKYTDNTGKPWEQATIQQIFEAGIVWPF